MTRRRVCSPVSIALVWLSLVSPRSVAAQASPQPPAQMPTTLKVGGDVRTPLSLAPEELKSMPRTRVQVKSEDGQPVTYEGVLVSELLKRAGAPLGGEMRGNAMATYVLASAADGYQVLFSLAELDPGFTGSEIIVADTIDGKPLFGYQGPWRIVAPKDTRPARAIRMLERIEVVRLKK
jgi:DMSO/TMAO reductase YedYZ molybdopterin-dependent catalytic subunit